MTSLVRMISAFGVGLFGATFLPWISISYFGHKGDAVALGFCVVVCLWTFVEQYGKS